MVSDDFSLPPNPELLNDWLFCHDHGHGDSSENHGESAQEALHDKSNELIYLKSNHEVISLLRKLTAGTDMLLEALDKQFNVLVKVVNTRAIVAFCAFEADCELNYVVTLSVIYKLLNASNKLHEASLKEARHSFKTDYFRVESAVLLDISKQLVSSSKHVTSKLSGDWTQGFLI